jgi:class 3 adenylate cyclase
MEEAARSHGVRCSRAVSDALAAHDRFEVLGEERVKGISGPIAISTYQVRESPA